MTELLSELEDCIPSPQTVKQEIEETELSALTSAWLRSLDSKERILFVHRYWNSDALKDLAAEYGISPGELAQLMYRFRNDLMMALEKEGILL